jgi:hypothetical protein
VTLDEPDEVVVWPSFWRAYWMFTLPLQLVLWVMAAGNMGCVYVLSGFAFPPGFFPIPVDAFVALGVGQVAILLFGLILGVFSQLCNRVRLTAEGVRPPSGATFRGRMVYPWEAITGAELEERWYGRWLTVTTARGRFFHLPVHVSDPAGFLEGVEHFANPGNPLTDTLRRHVCGWTRRPHFGSI